MVSVRPVLFSTLTLLALGAGCITQPVSSAEDTLPEVQILGAIPNDDSVKLRIKPFPGAVDYRVYPEARPKVKKYSAGGLVLEWNGIKGDPDMLVVEAVDRLGPYQYMDGRTPHHVMHSINGHGPKDAQPRVLGRSKPFPVRRQPHPFRSFEDVVFFDDYRSGEFKQRQNVVDPRSNTVSQQFSIWDNDTWTVRGIDVCIKNTQIFIASDHIMDIVRDGGTVGSNVPERVSFGELLFSANREVDLSGGKIVHYTFEVDAHFPGGRRWWNTYVTAPGDWISKPKAETWDPKAHPSVQKKPTLQWQIGPVHTLGVWKQGGGYTPITQQAHGAGPDNFNWCQRSGEWAPKQPSTGRSLNGGPDKLDLRHRFDLYFSQKRVQIWEEGILCKDAPIDLPLERAVIHIGHGLYHSSLEHEEIKKHAPHERYYVEHVPDKDERHWDNVGARYVPAFPTRPKLQKP